MASGDDRPHWVEIVLFVAFIGSILLLLWAVS
jgi:hypothetical protein